MAESRHLTWLHRIGYVTTVIVLVEVGLIASFALAHWQQRQRDEAPAREHTRTRDGPLTDQAVVDTLAQSPSRTEMAGDGLRFVAMPSFYGRWYVIAVHLPAGSDRAQGVFEAFQIRAADGSQTRPQPAQPPQAFVIPKADYAAFVKRVDVLTDGWAGDAHGMCFDGAPVAFERVRGERITSGSGNESCSSHYHALNLEVRQMLKRYDPQGKFPVSDDWMDDPAGKNNAAEPAR